MAWAHDICGDTVCDKCGRPTRRNSHSGRLLEAGATGVLVLLQRAGTWVQDAEQNLRVFAEVETGPTSGGLSRPMHPAWGLGRCEHVVVENSRVRGFLAVLPLLGWG